MSLSEENPILKVLYENKNVTDFLQFYLFIFTQDSLFSAYCAVINEGPAIEVLIIFKAAI